MATGADVLRMLCPAGGWVVYGDDFDSIIWDNDQPKCTKAEFMTGFEQYDIWKAEQDAKVLADKNALLNKLGITADEAKLLLS